MFNAVAAPGEDYRALVCLFLSGGIDSYNLLVPSGAAEYQQYAAVRGDLALPQPICSPSRLRPPTGGPTGSTPA
jgi:uncharacterized protein (DUF1501 family)